MTERDLLLTAILSHPDDDTPRFVYADWLQEHGEDDRADFIRAQCRLEHDPPGGERKRLAVRAADLRVQLFTHLNALGFADVTFRRGFISLITSGILHFRDRAAALTTADAPAFALELEEDERDSAVWETDYDDYIRVLEEVGERPELQRCVSLGLPCLGMGPGATILGSPNLTALRRLDFPDNETGPGIHNLARETFANLQWVNVHNSDSAADCPSITPLAECPSLANLEYLDFGANEQGSDDLRAVAAAKQWSRLRYLSLTCSTFGESAATEFFATPNLPALRELDLSHTFNGPLHWDTVGNGDPFTEAIAGSPLLARLSKLWLQGNGITDDGAKALASAPPSVKLEVLDLSRNPISDVGQRVLRKRFGEDVCVFEGKDRD